MTMYGVNRIDDARRFLHAFISNQLAHIAPRLYLKLTSQTGRGTQKESVQQIADYFFTCFHDYFHVLGIGTEHISEYLKGKYVLEYGPGDIPGIGLLMLAYGAESVVCVDRFPMYSLSGMNLEVLRQIINSLEGEARLRAERYFQKSSDLTSGLFNQRFQYIIHPFGISGLTDAVDLVISRAVLEHVNDLFSTFADMNKSLRNGGIAVHRIDLGSHGLHRHNPLDFLTWPPHLWSLMFSHKGYMNRWRANQYRDAVLENGLEIVMMEPVKVANKSCIEEVRPHLAAPFNGISDEDLSWLDFWLICRKAHD